MEGSGKELTGISCGEDEKADGTAPGVLPSLCLDDIESMQVEMLEKARELFRLCDKEQKGFITKLDMQRLQSELPLTTEQLEAVFDSLEQNNNGYLTPVEFSMGLGKLIGIGQYQAPGSFQHEETFESGWLDDLDQRDEDEKRFCSLLEQLEASQIFEDQSDLQELWAQLRKERPELLGSFEEFLFRISSYVRDVHREKESIEKVLKRRETDHDREIRCLYEEMEQQIKAEREQVLCQESMRLEKSNLLQKELHNKEQEFEKLLYHQKKLEHRLKSQDSEHLEIRVQNERLRVLNESLLDQLERSKWELEVARSHLQQLHKEAQREQEKKDRDVFRVSKNMQKEKKSLLRQLELLREMNKKLRDERDAFEAKKLALDSKRLLLKKGSVIDRYLVEKKPVKRSEHRQLYPGEFPFVLPDSICLDEPCKINWKFFLNWARENSTSTDEDAVPNKTFCGRQKGKCEETMPMKGNFAIRKEAASKLGDLHLCPRSQISESCTCSPDRLFKAAFLGNSGVGKSSFIHRFCYNRFLAEISSTVGIDFQMKSLMVDNTHVVLQLWDTAGQERFRSVTKQYFRRLDGILIMYDVVEECSFMAVRQWMACVQDEIEDGVVIFLLGNKIDAANEKGPKISKTEGERLAKEYKAVFYECSALTGYNIQEPMVHMARSVVAYSTGGQAQMAGLGPTRRL